MVMPLAILAEFAIKGGRVDAFRRLIVDNAHRSLQHEAGCKRFDVLVMENEPRQIVLYEIYDDEAAFDRHLETQHYKAFAKASEGMVDRISVRRLTFLDPHSDSEGGRE
jgi:(4S)-4-hydroxy-5-phosphonooxypentane-2,3-dione isomerase